ncbi:MAG: hypothetical protein ABSD74_08455 [Rhizomicrobium sp.]|jgi:predicted protein tyrosine phosphatase
MTKILITPLSEIERTIRDENPSHLVTLLSPEHMIDTPQGFRGDRHLRIAMNDVAEMHLADMPPSGEHIARLLTFGRSWTAEAPILVHCWAGISRSTAAAYILLSDRLGSGTENEIAKALRYRAPHAYPNPLMISHADALLQRDGRMIAAVRSIGRGTIAALGERVELPISIAEL